ncbi:MAG: NAD(P)-binding domain-containing protein [Gemmataceae bacterium]
MTQSKALRVAVLGAGPIGLEAGLYSQKLGLSTTIYERARPGEFLRRWGHVRLFSPFSMNATSLGRAAIGQQNPQHEFPADADCLTGRQHVASYVEPLAQTPDLKKIIKTDTQVLSVGRQGLLKEDSPGDGKRGRVPFRLLVRESKGRERVEEADVVLDCTGTYGQHRWLGNGGIPAVGEMAAEQQISYGLDDVLGEKKNTFAGKSILVIGSGYSAATSVCNLAALAEQNAETWIIWLARSGKTTPIRRISNDPLKERDRLAVRANTLATRGEGNVEFHGQSIIEAIESLGPDKGFRVAAMNSGKPRTWEVERVVANVGYSPDTNLYRELQVHECYASLGPMNLAADLLKQNGSDCLAITSTSAETLRNPEPNFFILGVKSYGRNSHFLLRNGFEQVRDVFRLITGKPELDLYKRH